MFPKRRKSYIMAKYFLVIIDTTQIQSYIFGSNKLRENISASYLVSETTSTYAIEVLKNLPKPFVIGGQYFDEDKEIEKDDIHAEIFYVGGGNFSVFFRRSEHAQNFIRELSKRILCVAPGLQIETICKEIDWNKDLKKQYSDALNDLANNKRARTFSVPLSGLGVTRVCQTTGQVAVGRTQPIAGDKESILFASAEVLAKRMVIDAANQSLQGYIPKEYQEEYIFPYKFDQLGGTSCDFSFIAVVHIDGDGMGDRIEKINGENNRDYVKRMRAFSAALNKAGGDSLKETIANALIASIDKNQKIREIELKKKDAWQWFLPIRPIVYGGDDLSFVCDARLGISIAINYIKAFEKNTIGLPDGKGKATACGGICMVKTHYPFSAAYQLAENLCHSAKEYRRQLKVEKSFIDWHFTGGGLYGDIEKIRSREYMGGQLTLRPGVTGDKDTDQPREYIGGHLSQKPVSIDDNEKNPLRSWKVVEKAIFNFQGDAWKSRRSKVKALRDALRGGRDSITAFIYKYLDGENLFQITDLPDPEIEKTGWKNGFSSNYDANKSSNWNNDFCCYFDAIELFDWYLALPIEVENETVS